MAGKLLTEEEISELLQSPYVIAAGDVKVHFTAEFKELFWKETQKGMTPRRIFKAYGIDPDILGPERLKGFKQMLRKDKKNGKEFRDIRDSNANIEMSFNTPEKELKYLKQKLAYQEQELEFLKKIASLGDRDQDT